MAELAEAQSAEIIAQGTRPQQVKQEPPVNVLSLVLPPGAAFAKALSKVQSELRTVGKDREVSVTPKEGGKSYKFKYATLDADWEAARAAVTSNGFALMQLPSVDTKLFEVTIESHLLHESGERATCRITMPCARKDVQGIGSAISYGRRYAMAAMLGLTSADEDDDGEAASPHSATPPVAASRMPPAPKPAPAPVGPQVSAAELDQQMRSCRDVGELTRVAARVKGAGLPDADRVTLIATYQQVLKELRP